MSLLQLPKDILRYIMSIVVYDIYIVEYMHADRSLQENIERMTTVGNFDCATRLSMLAEALQNLCQTHSVFENMHCCLRYLHC